MPDRVKVPINPTDMDFIALYSEQNASLLESSSLTLARQLAELQDYYTFLSDGPLVTYVLVEVPSLYSLLRKASSRLAEASTAYADIQTRLAAEKLLPLERFSYIRLRDWQCLLTGAMIEAKKLGFNPNEPSLTKWACINDFGVGVEARPAIQI